MGDVTVWNLTWGGGYINLAYVKMHVTYTKKKKKEKRSGDFNNYTKRKQLKRQWTSTSSESVE